MTTQQALKVLEDATAMLQLNRNDHQIIVAALNTLRTAIPAPQPAAAPKEEEKKEAAPEAAPIQ